MEEWIDIKGYVGYYKVSNLGRIKSVDRYVTKSNGVVQLRRGGVKKKSIDKDGYETVNLCKEGSCKRMRVHRIVADAFVEGKFEGADVNHINFNRADNRADNLEWVSHQHNIYKSIDAGHHFCCRDLYGENNPNYGNRYLSNFYKENPKIALEKQGRRGSTNGRSIPVVMIYNSAPIIFGYYGECAQYLIKNKLTNISNTGNLISTISRLCDSNTTYNDCLFYRL